MLPFQVLAQDMQYHRMVSQIILECRCALPLTIPLHTAPKHRVMFPPTRLPHDTPRNLHSPSRPS